jgi:predicted cation transporter
MSQPIALTVLVLLLVGPITWHRIERNIELYFLVLGLISASFAGVLDMPTAVHAATEPIPTSAAVIAAGSLFALMRGRLDEAFEAIRVRIPRPILAALAVFAVAILSSLITAIVAVLVLVEIVGMMRPSARAQVNATIAGCFAIGICSVLTPLGGPLSTLAASALGLGFWGLFKLLGGYVLPGTIACALIAGVLIGSEAEAEPRMTRIVFRETLRDALVQGMKIYAFIAGVRLIAETFEPVVRGYVNLLGDGPLFWANSISAVLDNATLVALEVHRMDPHWARAAIIALLLSGGMLIPGNVPNIVAAGAMRISSGEWARLGVPMGLVLMCIYFALLFG